MKNTFFDVLKLKDFQKIWWSQVFSQIALNMLTFALVLHIFEITGRAASISLVMLASAIPVAIIGPFSGVLADKVNCKKILNYTNFLRFLAVLLLLLARNNVLASLEIIFVISALSQIFTPAESSSIPALVPREKLLSANSLVMTTTYVTMLIGYTAAGPLLSLVGSFWLFLICAALYLAATEATRLLSEYDKKFKKPFTFERMANAFDKVWAEMKMGIDYIKKNSKILNPIVKQTIGWAILGAFITVLPAYGSSVLSIDPKFIGALVIGPAGVGMLISALILSKKKQVNHEKIINSGFLIVSIALFVFSTYKFYSDATLSKLVLLMAIIFLGFGSSMVQISTQTSLQLNTEEDKRGRVFGLSSMQLRLATALPALAIGAVSDLTSPLISMLILSLGIILYTLTLVFE